MVASVCSVVCAEVKPSDQRDLLGFIPVFGEIFYRLLGSASLYLYNGSKSWRERKREREREREIERERERERERQTERQIDIPHYTKPR